MPLIAHSDLPAFRRLRAEGQEILDPNRASQQDIRELHIGLFNIMPDAALEATERQFLRLIGSSNRIAQFYVHLFTADTMPRSAAAQQHIDSHYRSFDELKREGLDALIISGANPALDDITQEAFWQPLLEVVDWAKNNVCSVMCSCLATHAIVQHLWGIERYKLPEKRWGVYDNRITSQPHPLTNNINTRFNVPHSHVYEVNSDQLREKKLMVLAEGPVSNLHLATSPDGLRFIFFQGHPEYDKISLFKEYKREVTRFLNAERTTYPAFPEAYFPSEAAEFCQAYKDKVLNCSGDYSQLESLPEDMIEPLLDNTWTDTGKAIANAWLGLIYQVANSDRGKVYMHEVNPDDPLGLLQKDLP